MDLFDQQVLAYEPWHDRDCDILVMRDRFVVTRKPHECILCAAEIPAKTRVRARAEIDRDAGISMTFYFCETCCSAMQIAVATEDMTAIDARYDLFRKR